MVTGGNNLTISYYFDLGAEINSQGLPAFSRAELLKD